MTTAITGIIAGRITDPVVVIGFAASADSWSTIVAAVMGNAEDLAEAAQAKMARFGSAAVAARNHGAVGAFTAGSRSTAGMTVMQAGHSAGSGQTATAA